MGSFGLPMVVAAADPGWDVSAGVVQRRLVERADSGARVVTESGPLLRLQAGLQAAVGDGGALRLDAAVAGGRLDYDGQTQAGVPLATRSDHRDLEGTLAWRPLAQAPWGEAWLVLRGLQQRRRIASNAVASGLEETSALVTAGVRWGHAWQAGGWKWQPSIEIGTSAHHRLAIDFGGIFDHAELRGGRRHALQLALQAQPVGSPWRVGLGWAHARQSASPLQPLARGGAIVGSVRQPRIDIDDVMLRVAREF